MIIAKGYHHNNDLDDDNLLPVVALVVLQPRQETELMRTGIDKYTAYSYNVSIASPKLLLTSAPVFCGNQLPVKLNETRRGQQRQPSPACMPRSNSTCGTKIPKVAWIPENRSQNSISCPGRLSAPPLTAAFVVAHEAKHRENREICLELPLSASL